MLALLYFSSAFDTIDHHILVHRLHTDVGFTDTVLQWFSSYLTDRTHYVSLSNHCSAFAPAYSVHGPILFNMYIKPLSAINDSHSIIQHSFADDLQLKMSAPLDKIYELLHSMHQDRVHACNGHAAEKAITHRNTHSSTCTMHLLNRPVHNKATLGDCSFSLASSSV